MSNSENDHIIQTAVREVISTVQLSIKLRRPSPLVQLAERLQIAAEDWDKAEEAIING